eukprot:11730421-Alexandrium_andersonii.AAC.1
MPHRTPHTHLKPHTAHSSLHSAHRPRHIAHSTSHTARHTPHAAHSTRHMHMQRSVHTLMYRRDMTSQPCTGALA